ncbi:MAG TPA: helix-turn-helix transcriptional regulator [Ktedonobacterales bacterium]|nr:helix-turn-helix transcriptional regulator [Ktedonobacterales bacterium]
MPVQLAHHLGDAAPYSYRSSTLSVHEQTIERVIGAMHEHMSAPLALEEMAEIACLSPFHFNRMFRSLIGIPPGEFLSALRMDAAKRLLLTTSLSVTDVCFELGYASLGTFTTRFKQLVGLSPLQLRLLAGEIDLSTLAALLDERRERRHALSLSTVSDHGVRGTIAVPAPFDGLIFAGLFPKPVPQGRPVACTTLDAPGRFQIAPVPDGRYYLLAAAVPRSRISLLSDAAPRVGVAERPVVVSDGRADATVDLVLRPRRPVDPPILGVFPPLLASRATLRAREYVYA